jgi:hypothetical protein
MCQFLPHPQDAFGLHPLADLGCDPWSGVNPEVCDLSKLDDQQNISTEAVF